MEVKDLVLYQVATDRNYKVGDVLHFGEEDNFQAYRVWNSKLYDDKGRFAKQGYDFVQSKKIFANKKLVKKLSKAIEEADFIIRELAIEEVRKTKYPDEPSRLRCMFLTDSKEDCLKGVKTFYQKGHGSHFQAIAVRLNGKVFYAKEKAIGRWGLSYKEYSKLADEYWSQNQNSNVKIQEILFEGEAEVIEIMDEYTHQK